MAEKQGNEDVQPAMTEDRSDRKPYSPPVLTVLGTLADLTRGGGKLNDDGLTVSS